jgi:hypothetical protein
VKIHATVVDRRYIDGLDQTSRIDVKIHATVVDRRYIDGLD